MKLFTKAIDTKLFEQYHKGSELADQMVVAKIFNPYGRGTWYLINSDPNDPDYIWAIVDLFKVETGSISRSELESIKVPPVGLGLERDLFFEPVNAKELLDGLLKGKDYKEGGVTDGENVVLNEDGTWFKIDNQEEQGIEAGHRGVTWQEEHEFNPHFEAGGSMNSFVEGYEAISMKIKAKIVGAIGIDKAVYYLHKDWVVNPYRLLERAVYSKLLSVDEIDEKVWQYALMEAEDIEGRYRNSGEGIGSSDMTYFIKAMLDGAGLKTDFVNGRLERVNDEGKPIQIENKFEHGGAINYKTMTAKELWESWTLEQREHFLYDHAHILKVWSAQHGQPKDEKYFVSLKDSPYEKLPFTVKREITEHMIQGQYASGGLFSGLNINGKYWYFKHDGKHVNGTAQVKKGGVVKVHLNKTTPELEDFYKEYKYQIIDAIYKDHTESKMEEWG